jgi:hypothetical protein
MQITFYGLEMLEDTIAADNVETCISNPTRLETPSKCEAILFELWQQKGFERHV